MGNIRTVQAQFNAGLFQEIKNKYGNEKVVQLNKDVTYQIKLVKGKPQILLYSNESFMYLKDVSVMGTKRSVFSSQMSQLVKYEANVYNLQDGRYKKTSIKNKKEISNFQQYTFYDDLHQYSIDFNSVKEGTIIELNTVHKITEPHLLRSIYFSEYLPIDKLTVKFVVDKGINLRIIPEHLDSIKLNYSEITEKSSKLYQWNGNKLDAIESEDDTPDEKYYVAHIIPLIESYNTGGKTVNVLRNTDDLYHWYYGFIREAIKDVDNTDLKKLADSLTMNCTTEIDKVKAVYYWVQSNIKYIAFEYGMGGFIPRKADDIFHKRYGDCKDKSCILYTLLDLAGIKGYFTWIGTNDIPYTYQQVPSPSTDNHMIISYKNGERWYFLDGTSNNLPLGMPSSFIQGKEALIAIDKDNYELQVVPVLKASDNLVCDSISIKFDNKQIRGTGKAELSGYPFYFFHYRYNSRDNSDQKETVKNYLEKGNNKFILSGYKITSMPDFERTGSLSYDFTVGDYIKSIDHEVYVNLNMDRSIADFRIDDKRKYPLSFEYNTEYHFKAVLEIPQNYKISYIPKNSEFKTPEYGYTISYKQQGNSLIYEHTNYRNTLLIGTDKLKDWKEFINKLENAYKETVLLKQIDN